MIRYALAAGALKAFSLNGATRRLYRHVGNAVGGRRRAANLDLEVYVERGNLLIELCRKYAAAQDGQRLLEIGTGWMHWFALYLRLFVDAEIATMDVWDNRQFDALAAAFEKLAAAPVMRSAPARVAENLRKLRGAASFEELYARLGLSYVVQPDGSLGMFADASRDCVFSFHVLEHVPRTSVPRLCADMYRVLKPGGFSIHQIGIDDHLAHYDRSCSHKQYLAYSERTWKWFFENTVQYINRLQMSDWVRAFGAAGFTVRETLTESVDISGLRIDPKYRDYSAQDLACTILTLVLQKPASASLA
jgi:SAM-dependent methyltransferase